MYVPTSFEKISKAFHQDIDISVNSFEEIPDYLLTFLNNNEKKELKLFLAELIKLKISVIQEVWKKYNRNFIFTPEESLRDFLKILEKKIH